MKISNVIATGVLGLGVAWAGTESADAASLGLTTEQPMIVVDAVDLILLDDFAGSGDLIVPFPAPVDSVMGLPGSQPSDFSLDFVVSFSFADPTMGLTGGFSLFDSFGTSFFLGGDIAAVGFAEDVIEFQFDTIIGPLSSVFGPSVLIEVTFDDPFDMFNDNPFNDQLTLPEFPAATLKLSKVTTVDGPASLSLLLSGFIGLWMIRRRK